MRRQLGEHVLDPNQVGLRRGQLGARVVQSQLVTADVGHVFKGDSTLVGPLQDQLVDRPLTDHRVAVRTQSGVQQQLGNVLESDFRAVQEVFAVARAEQAPRDAHLLELDGQTAIAIVEHQRDFRHTQRLPRSRPGKDHLLRLASPDRLGRLLAQHPQHTVADIRFTGTVWTDHDDDAGLELGGGA